MPVEQQREAPLIEQEARLVRELAGDFKAAFGIQRFAETGRLGWPVSNLRMINAGGRESPADRRSSQSGAEDDWKRTGSIRRRLLPWALIYRRD
jgi:hypothetical protein